MHYLLIQQLLIDETVKLVHAQGFKALNEAKFDTKLLINVLKSHGINSSEADKWIAYMHIEDYIKLTANDHNRNPTYITLTPKGMAAETSKYFKEKYNEIKKGNFKYWIEVPSQFIVGVAAIIALLISGNESCNKSDKNQHQPPSINIYNTIPETKSYSTRQENKLYYDSVAKKLFYLDTFYIGVDTVYIQK